MTLYFPKGLSDKEYHEIIKKIDDVIITWSMEKYE